MKTKLFVTALIAMFCTQTQAQWYINVGGGYALANAPNNYLYDEVRNFDGSIYSSTYTTTKGFSYGKGASVSFAVGTRLNNMLSAEVGVGYLASAKYTSQFTSTYTGFASYTSTYSGSMIRLVPAVVLEFPGEGVKPYARAGLMIGVGTKTTFTSVSTGSSPNNSELAQETKGGSAIGFSGSFGVNIPLQNGFSLFSELSMVSQSYTPAKSVWTKYTVSGQDQLPNVPLNLREREFVDAYTSSSVTNPNETSKSTKVSLPFSSIGLNIGLHWTLGGKKVSTKKPATSKGKKR